MFLVAGVQRLLRLRDEHPVFKGLQLVSAGAISFGHGANDAQKTMGVIAALLLATGHTQMSADGTSVQVPEWVALSAYSAIALGTLWGGWKIIETLALKITTLHASSGAAANIGASAAIFGATALGMPISTTHAAASSIVGAGPLPPWRALESRRSDGAGVVAHDPLCGRGRHRSCSAWIGCPRHSGVTVGLVLATFARWVGSAMTHTIHADDVEAEVPSEAELDLRDSLRTTSPETRPPRPQSTTPARRSWGRSSRTSVSGPHLRSRWHSGPREPADPRRQVRPQW